MILHHNLEHLVTMVCNFFNKITPNKFLTYRNRDYQKNRNKPLKGHD